MPFGGGAEQWSNGAMDRAMEHPNTILSAVAIWWPTIALCRCCGNSYFEVPNFDKLFLLFFIQDILTPSFQLWPYGGPPLHYGSGSGNRHFGSSQK